MAAQELSTPRLRDLRDSGGDLMVHRAVGIYFDHITRDHSLAIEGMVAAKTWRPSEIELVT